ncbi:MAG: flagellar biosynthesis anti-sigma factor FlgM [Nautilia sp.]|nr:MAG: flagellar biosynthesis anti-sigma factor FlgM [Nautilia sp.]
MINGISSNNSTFFTTISGNKKDNTQQIEKVEKSKIETLKESIKNGTYKIDIEKTANSMAKKLL